MDFSVGPGPVKCIRKFRWVCLFCCQSHGHSLDLSFPSRKTLLVYIQPLTGPPGAIHTASQALSLDHPPCHAAAFGGRPWPTERKLCSLCSRPLGPSHSPPTHFLHRRGSPTTHPSRNNSKATSSGICDPKEPVPKCVCAGVPCTHVCLARTLLHAFLCSALHFPHQMRPGQSYYLYTPPPRPQNRTNAHGV